MNPELLLEDYLYEIRLRNYSERTIKTVRTNCRLFFSWLKYQHEIVDIEKVRKIHVKEYLNFKQQQGLSPTYINSILKNLRMFFRYLEEEEYIELNPVVNVKFQKEEKVIIQSFTAEEVKNMLSVYGYDTFLEARNCCIVAMLFDTGIRNFELCKIKIEDIRETSILIHGKGSKQRLVPISPNLRIIMFRYQRKREQYLKEHYQGEYYFLSNNGNQLTIEAIEIIVRECGKQAGVSEEIRCSPHTCRHTYAQMNVRNGIDVYSLSRLLGHENISITKRYLQSMKDTDVLNIAIKTSPLMNL